MKELNLPSPSFAKENFDIPLHCNRYLGIIIPTLVFSWYPHDCMAAMSVSFEKEESIMMVFPTRSSFMQIFTFLEFNSSDIK